MTSSTSEPPSDPDIVPGLPGIDRFYDMADLTRRSLPDVFAKAASDVVLQVVDWPPQDMLDAFGVRDARELTGLYDGVPLTEKSFVDQPFGVDVIWLFREPILDEWMTRRDVSLERLVGHVYIHELAHHFGWSDEDIAEIDEWWR